MESLLLCDEKLFFSTPSPPPTSRNGISSHCIMPNSPRLFSDSSDEENDRVLQRYFSREKIYRPASDYYERLQHSSNLRAARFKAVRWIFMAGSRLSLQYGTVFAAVNYLDRFISLNSHIKKWEVWMIELVSIACLSIASKVDEIFVQSFDDFQTADLEHLYHSSTIQQTELAILKALDWRLLCITPYSYVDIIISRLACPHTSMASRTIKHLTRALSEAKYVNCSASALAASAVRSSIEELVPLESDAYLSVLENLMPEESKVEIVKCHALMKEQRADPHCCPMSPVTVIPMQKADVLDSHVDIDTCFLCSRDPSEDFCSSSE